jgi:predicted RNA-binding protein with PIN domain
MNDVCREMEKGVEVVYTKGSDADMFIAAEAKAQRARGVPRVVVISEDREISQSLDLAAGMGWMPVTLYLQEMRRVRTPQGFWMPALLLYFCLPCPPRFEGAWLQ